MPRYRLFSQGVDQRKNRVEGMLSDRYNGVEYIQER
jgi:hypothetical protein